MFTWSVLWAGSSAVSAPQPCTIITFIQPAQLLPGAQRMALCTPRGGSHPAVSKDQWPSCACLCSVVCGPKVHPPPPKVVCAWCSPYGVLHSQCAAFELCPHVQQLISQLVLQALLCGQHLMPSRAEAEAWRGVLNNTSGG